MMVVNLGKDPVPSVRSHMDKLDIQTKRIKLEFFDMLERTFSIETKNFPDILLK